MWIAFGIGSIIAAMLNIIWLILNKNPQWFRFISLSLTALTVCAFYSMDAKWVINEDWAALMDVTPNMSKILWVLTVISILINSISLFKKRDK